MSHNSTSAVRTATPLSNSKHKPINQSHMHVGPGEPVQALIMPATVQHLWCVAKQALPFEQKELGLAPLADPEKPEVIRTDAQFFLLSR